MNMQSIRVVARNLGIKPGRTTKLRLIRDIQSAEGNFPCFAKALDFSCDQQACLWRDDCFRAVKKGSPA